MSGIDNSPLQCPPGEKAEREAANGVKQLDYLTDLVIGERAIKDIRETHILDLQKLAVAGIYPCGGDYRDARTKIIISDSEHEPPEAAFVPSRVIELLDYINSTRDTLPALERAATRSGDSTGSIRSVAAMAARRDVSRTSSSVLTSA